jgi:branched-chain amino acid transport system substrate-binding protein
MANLAGQSLGRYHILEQLGEGGMATVYKAYDARLERDVAVKIIRRQTFPEEQLERILKRFEREAKALARLTHPNIVPVIDYGEYEGAPYLVMPYLPGGTLKQRLGTPMPWQEAVRILLPIAQALEYAHEHNIIHRDIKPSNILLTEKGQPMLSDFGIAKIIESADTATLTGAGVGVGTPEYMAPEQWTGGAGPQADLYSLGVVFYELVTGRKPYTADTPAAILLKQATEPLPRPTQFVRDLPEAMEKLLLKALAKRPEDRYENMTAFAAAMETLLRGQSQPAQPAIKPAPSSSQENDSLPTIEQGAAPVEIPPAPPVPAEPMVPSYLPPAKKRVWWPWAAGGLLVVAGIIISILAIPGLVTKSVSTPTEPTSTRNTVYSCTDSIGCLRIGPKDPIHIAYLLVVAGPNAALGTDSRNGVEIAINDARGMMLGHAIKFDGEDGGCSTAGGQAAAAKLAADPTIIAVIGPSCSSEARAAEKILSIAGFVTISPSSTAPDLTDPASSYHYAGFFRTAHNDNIQGAAAADFAYNFLGIRKAATINDGSLYADKLQHVFADSFRALGGMIWLQTSITVGQTDMSPTLSSIAAGSPELVYFPIFLPEGAHLIQQARATPGLKTTKLMVADGLYSPDVVNASGAAIEGVYVSSPLIQGAPYDTFVAHYVARFGGQPINVFHAHAYDAFNIIIFAIKKVAVLEPDGTIYIPRQALRDAVAATSNFQGLTGLLTCSASGDCANPIIGVYQYHAGQYPPTLIWPTQYVK